MRFDLQSIEKKLIINLVIYIAILTITSYLTFVIITVPFEQTKLKYVIIISRHGARAPVRIIPNDYYNESFWIQNHRGLSSLTQTGMQQQFQFGKFIKNYYGDFFSSINDTKSVFIRCTDYDRSYYSAQKFLFGFFNKNSNSHFYNSDGFFTLLEKVHPFNDSIFHQSRECPMFQYLVKQKSISKDHLKIKSKYNNMVDYLSNISGLSINSYMELSKLADPIISEVENNLTLINWAKYYKDDIIKARDYCFYFHYGDQKMARLVSGPILNEIKRKLDQKINNRITQDLAVYMTHDSYLCAMKTLLNTACKSQPNFSSAIIIELREDSFQNKYIQILSKDNKNTESISLEKLNIKGCSKLCPLNKFYSLIEPDLIEDIEKECKLKN